MWKELNVPATCTSFIKNRVLLCAVVLLVLALGRGSRAESPVGINMAPVYFYNTEWVFVDAMKSSSHWIPQLVSGGPWDTGAPLSQTADGYPLLAPGQAVATLMFVDIQGHYPGGNYVCLYDGQGTIEFGNDAHLVSQTPGRMVVNVTPSNSGILLRVTATNHSNPIRNIRMIMPGFEATYQTQPFHPTYLARLQNYRSLRFMDWQKTNTTNQVNWSDRTPPNYRTMTAGSGVAVEVMVRLCNTLGADPWFCMPHTATDDYVRQFARVVRDNLNPALNVYIEHSNEVWNGGFVQAGYCQQKGLQLGLASDPYLAGVRYHSKRSVEIFNIWRSEFGGQASRVVRVLAAQHDNPWIGRQIMDYQNAWQHADAVAVAPYFGYYLGLPGQANSTAAMSIDQILTLAQNEMMGTRRNLTIEGANDAAARGLKFIAYEGGQHLVGVGSAMSNSTLNQKFWQANRAQRMYDLYLQDLSIWEAAGGDLFVEYSSAGRYTEWGSWGTYEWQNQPISSAPKYAAIQDFIASGGSAPPKLRQYTGNKANGRLGFVVANAGDINNDGVNDILVTAPDATVTAPQGGQVFIYSGANGAQLFYKVGHVANERFGYSAAGIGDVNNDGHDDVAIGAWGNNQAGANAGKVYVYSGATQTLLYTLVGQAANDRFGFALAGLGDVNGDGRPDFAVGAWGHDAAGENAGRVYIHSGTNGATLRTIDGLSSGERFGYAVAGPGDVTGDGVADVLIGAPWAFNQAGQQAGRAYVYHANSGTQYQVRYGETANAMFGRSVAWVGDVNADGRNDYAIGAFRNNQGGYETGKAYVYSGTGPLLFSKTGAAIRHRFGLGISGIGDINQDGKADFAIGSHKAGGSGRVYIYLGGNFQHVATYRGDFNADKFGHNISPLGDINGDNRPDFLVGAWGHSSAAFHGGRGYVISGIISQASSAIALGDYDGDEEWWINVTQPMSLHELGLAGVTEGGAVNLGNQTGGSANLPFTSASSLGDDVSIDEIADSAGASSALHGETAYVLAGADELNAFVAVSLGSGAAQLGTNEALRVIGTADVAALRNAALLSPFDFDGRIVLPGDFVQGSRGVLAMHVEASEEAGVVSETMSVSGSVRLGGTLIVSVDPTMPLQAGQEFELITANQVQGRFTTAIVPVTETGLTFEIIVEEAAVRVRVIEASQLHEAADLPVWIEMLSEAWSATSPSAESGEAIDKAPRWLIRMFENWSALQTQG